MAGTDEGRRLTEEHRQAQLGVRFRFLREFLALWVLLDSLRLDETGPGWVQAVLPVIQRFRMQSAEISTDYFQQYRAAEVPRIAAARPAAPSPAGRAAPSPREPRQARVFFDDSMFRNQTVREAKVEVPDIDWSSQDRAARVSLFVTGPVNQKSKAKRGKPVDTARDESFVDASGAGSRHVLTGGRQSLLTLIQQDETPVPKRWIRVTDGDPCSFCALLASRGPVYVTERSAAFHAHDNCACTAEPVYDYNAPWPGRAAEFRRLYREVAEGEPDQRNAFRRAYEQRQRDARRQLRA